MAARKKKKTKGSPRTIPKKSKKRAIPKKSKKTKASKAERSLRAKIGWLRRKQKIALANRESNFKSKKLEKIRAWREYIDQKEIDKWSMKKMDGSPAKNPSMARHLPYAGDIMSELDRESNGNPWSDEFHNAAQQIAAYFDLDVQEIYTMWFSP